MKKIKLAVTTNIVLACIFTIVIVLHYQQLNQFFSADDWFHLKISRISSVGEFVNFFSFSDSPQRASFYRPLGTQVFFFMALNAFGMNTIWWCLASLVLVLLSIWLVYILMQRLLDDTSKAVIATGIFALSQTNFTRLYFISGVQETMLICFVVFTIYLFVSPKTWHKRAAWMTFMLALMSKESAVLTPVYLGLVGLWEIGKRGESKQWRGRVKTLVVRLLPFIGISLVYLFLRTKVFGFESSDHSSYQVIISPSVFNTLFWYGLWAVGAFEGFVNYVGSGLQVIPRYFDDMKWLAWPHLVLLSGTLLSMVVAMVAVGRSLVMKLSATKTVKLKVWWDHYWLGAGLVWFMVGLLPVLFMPNHKFALTLGMSMVGFSLAITDLFSKAKTVKVVGLELFVLLNIVSIAITQRTHYTVLRSEISRKVYAYFIAQYPDPPEHAVVLFTNDVEGLPSNWGVSKQIKEALMGDNFFHVLYPGKELRVFYEDDQPSEVPDDALRVGAGQFL